MLKRNYNLVENALKLMSCVVCSVQVYYFKTFSEKPLIPIVLRTIISCVLYTVYTCVHRISYVNARYIYNICMY